MQEVERNHRAVIEHDLSHARHARDGLSAREGWPLEPFGSLTTDSPRLNTMNDN